ncbi:MAG: hypothetical protein QM724_10095 [Flavobacteriales bacterium]
MKRALLLGVFAVPVLSTAQIAHGGQPLGWGHTPNERDAVPRIGLSVLDRSALLAEADAAPANTGFRYGTQRQVDADVLGQGTWQDLPDGSRVCRLQLSSPGAVMLSVQFDRFAPGPDGRVFLYNADRSYFIGGFTQENAQPTGGLATAVVPGDAITIEYQTGPHPGPAGLHVASLTHGFRDILHFRERGVLRDIDPGYQSAPCQDNVACPSAANWQDQRRSVALFLRPDGGGCTGVLLNNTLQNGTPYFHIANHCYQPTESQWVFYFNYDSPACVGTAGPTDQTVSGSTLRALTYHGDFCLVEMSAQPPAAYNVYYSGWDRSGSQPGVGAMIHHPLSDVKKIAFPNAAPATYFTPDENTECWRVFWGSGLAQGGSSGAPLFDRNKRMVGSASDGQQECATATTIPSIFAKLSANWDGTLPSSRLRDWLDPANTTTALNGINGSAVHPALGVKVSARIMLEGPYASGSMNANLRTNGLPTTEPFTALGFTHVGGGGGETMAQAVLNVTGTNAIVDWVLVELRSKSDASQVLATRSALVRSDGMVVDVNGTDPVNFPQAVVDNYFVAIKGRNHLGIMTATSQPLTGVAVLMNFINGSTATYGGDEAMKTINGIRCLWAGDVDHDGVLMYTGAGNDRDPILVRIGGTVPTATVSGYYVEDVNMDGVVKYTGTGNDRDPILVNIGGTVPTATRRAQLP